MELFIGIMKIGIDKNVGFKNNAVVNKITRAADMFPVIQEAFANGKRVQVTTHLKSTIYDKRHADMFKVRGNSLYVRRGRKNWDCLDYCGIRIEA